MRIAVLNPSYEGSDSAFTGHDPVCDPSRWVAEHTFERFAIRKATAARQVHELSKRGYDAFVNLCDGAWDEDRAGIEVVHALERFGCAFTGATSSFYEPSRETMKRVCHYWGLRTPEGVFVDGEADVEVAARELKFPLIVKHRDSYGSVGMTKDSRVETPEQLREQVRRMLGTYGGALVEEFVAGREFTVLVAENPDDPARPLTFQPVECRFPPGETFKHFDLKWVDFAGMSWVPVADEALCGRLREASATLFTGLGGTGYGRCDIRMDADGELFLLEINPNCGIFYPPESWGSADFILSNDPMGHAGFVRHALDVAIRRQRARERVWEIRRLPGKGYGMYARRAISTGEVVDRWEERPHVLASKGHVERTWDEQRRRWFGQYAWPLNDEIFVTWDENPAEWRPIDHACDPNTWLDGLDLVARRPIAKGEAVTMDYATFCAETMAPFECRCGAADCRGSVSGEDHLAPFVARYGEHVSAWVRARRRAAGL